MLYLAVLSYRIKDTNEEDKYFRLIEAEDEVEVSDMFRDDYENRLYYKEYWVDDVEITSILSK